VAHVEIVCATHGCGQFICTTSEHEERLRRTHEVFYCPAGHHNYFAGQTLQEKQIKDLEARLANLQRSLSRYGDILEETQAEKRQLDTHGRSARLSAATSPDASAPQGASASRFKIICQNSTAQYPWRSAMPSPPSPRQRRKEREPEACNLTRSIRDRPRNADLHGSRRGSLDADGQGTETAASSRYGVAAGQVPAHLEAEAHERDPRTTLPRRMALVGRRQGTDTTEGIEMRTNIASSDHPLRLPRLRRGSGAPSGRLRIDRHALRPEPEREERELERVGPLPAHVDLVGGEVQSVRPAREHARRLSTVGGLRRLVLAPLGRFDRLLVLAASVACAAALLPAVAQAAIIRCQGNECYGTQAPDKIIGTTGFDFVFGNHGGDLLKLRSGHDMGDGGAGPDEILGGGGDDELYGAGGGDFIQGGRGHDRISGGSGGDDIDAQDGSKDIVYAGAGTDWCQIDVGLDEVHGCNFTGGVL
jgi:hypothetical protein